jgi:hypothetical protein
VRIQLELVGAEGHDLGLAASGADGCAEQQQVEHNELEGWHALLVGGVLGAGHRSKQGEHDGQGEEDHTELVDDGAKHYGLEATGLGVDDEAVDEWPCHWS